LGYTHYWSHYDIDDGSWTKIINDFQVVRRYIKDVYNIDIAGPDGLGQPVFNDRYIAFNGMANCGHKKKNLTIPWPTNPNSSDRFKVKLNPDAVPTGEWYAGHLIPTRTCNGDCSYETFMFKKEKEEFNCCKTAYRPYDLHVCCFLIIAHHYVDHVSVASDGTMDHWMDAKLLCVKLLNVGWRFKLSSNITLR